MRYSGNNAITIFIVNHIVNHSPSKKEKKKVNTRRPPIIIIIFLKLKDHDTTINSSLLHNGRKSNVLIRLRDDGDD